jgi:hypothetical protein
LEKQENHIYLMLYQNLTTRKIEDAITGGISFLRITQLASGEFVTTRAPQIDMTNSSEVSSVFLTSFIVHCLTHLKKYYSVNDLLGQASDFLLSQKEGKGYYRFFGKETHLPLDLDCTCCVLAALIKCNIKLDYDNIADFLLHYRNEAGVFYTWMPDLFPTKNQRDFQNDIDCVVNANALFFYSLIRRHLPVLVDYLNNATKKQFRSGSIYYYSPISYTYCLSRTYADGSAEGLSPIIGEITDYLLNIWSYGAQWGNTLENSMAAVSLLNCGYRGNVLTKAIIDLLCRQESTGGWSNSAFFAGIPDLYYGSSDLTTAIAIEALWKYLVTIDRG